MTGILNMAIEKGGNSSPRLGWHGIGRYWVPLIGYMVLIFYLSSQPLEELQLPEIWNIDKLLHIVEYGVLGVLWLRALTRYFYKGARLTLKWLALLFTILYGVSDEVHQMLVPNRTPSIFDVMADGLGAWLGVWLYNRFVVYGSRFTG